MRRFQAQHRPERRQRQLAKVRPLLGERLVDHPPGGGVHARVGHRVQPAAELVVEVVQVPEAAREEEVLAD